MVWPRQRGKRWKQREVWQKMEDDGETKGKLGEEIEGKGEG